MKNRLVITKENWKKETSDWFREIIESDKIYKKNFITTFKISKNKLTRMMSEKHGLYMEDIIDVIDFFGLELEIRIISDSKFNFEERLKKVQDKIWSTNDENGKKKLT